MLQIRSFSPFEKVQSTIRNFLPYKKSSYTVTKIDSPMKRYLAQ
ncbi:hypothetical protein [Clostridium beijerinckii]|nr:hypothetical protein [Clostridium beijerinckii]NRZ27748.1 hypothetical protein [Clostridium beijerinckii]